MVKELLIALICDKSMLCMYDWEMAMEPLMEVKLPTVKLETLPKVKSLTAVNLFMVTTASLPLSVMINWSVTFCKPELMVAMAPLLLTLKTLRENTLIPSNEFKPVSEMTISWAVVIPEVKPTLVNAGNAVRVKALTVANWAKLRVCKRWLKVSSKSPDTSWRLGATNETTSVPFMVRSP